VPPCFYASIGHLAWVPLEVSSPVSTGAAHIVEAQTFVELNTAGQGDGACSLGLLRFPKTCTLNLTPSTLTPELSGHPPSPIRLLGKEMRIPPASPHLMSPIQKWLSLLSRQNTRLHEGVSRAGVFYGGWRGLRRIARQFCWTTSHPWARPSPSSPPVCG
jgi:hypothetical protein